LKIDTFKMERMQCLYERKVRFNLSESGVKPLKLSELVNENEDLQNFLSKGLWYNESDGSEILRERISQFYPDCKPENITVTNGGSEANYVTLWTLLEPEGRLACMLPNYMQSWGLGRIYAGGIDTYQLVLDKTGKQSRWALDIESLKQAVTPKTTVIIVTNPNNPTGSVLTGDEMDVIVEAAQKVGAWLVVDEIYRGAEVEGDISPTFWGRYDKVVITSGLSKAFALPGLRIGWVVAPPKLIEQLWIRHDYLTLTPCVLSDYLGSIAMEPKRREEILARTRQIVRSNLPLLEEWFLKRDDLFTFIRPQAGAIAYFDYNIPIKPLDLINRLIAEKSVLLTPAEHFGLEKGMRTGFGYNIEKTLKGLELAEEFMRNL